MRKNMVKALSTNSKDRYRKKPYTPPSKKIEKNKFTKLLLPRLSKLKDDSNINRKALYELLHEIGQNGARLDIVAATLHPADIKPLLLGINKKDAWMLDEIKKRMYEAGVNLTLDVIKKKEEEAKTNLTEKEKKKIINAARFKWLDLMFCNDSQEKDLIDEHGKKVTAWGKKKRSIKGAVKQVLNLEPLKLEDGPKNYIDGLNNELKDVQRCLESVLERYLNIKEWSKFPPRNEYDTLDRASCEDRPSKQKSQNRKQRYILQLTVKGIVLVNELTKIGYSDRSSDTITAKILNLSYPAYSHSTAANVRSTINHHTKKSK